jgi:hypothetical protein
MSAKILRIVLMLIIGAQLLVANGQACPIARSDASVGIGGVPQQLPRARAGLPGPVPIPLP